MPVDVQSEIVIQRPRAVVAAYASDPDNAARWREDVSAVEWQTQPPLAVGSRVAFVSGLLGSRLAYAYEVQELQPGEQLVVNTEDGPFDLQTTYAWRDAPDDATQMTLRTSGKPASKLATPLIARALRRSNRRDLKRLKEILERDRT